MRIIEKGTLPDDRKFTVRCAVCSTKFEFQGKEARRTDGELSIIFALDCPTCSNLCTATTPSRGTALD